MEEETDIQNTSIQSLPNEILTMILQESDINDIVSFGSTCKRFREIVENDQILWKHKFKTIIPSVMVNTVEKHGDGNWLNAIKEFFVLRNLIYTEIMAMSSKYYWKTSEVTLEDVRNYFAIALSSQHNYYYVVYILQDLIRKGNSAYIEKKCAKKPFTLTDMYYAKMVLRYLVHTFLGLKWVRAQLRKELPPERVVNFFVQWIDTVNLHHDSDIEQCINDMVSRVKKVLDAQNPKLAFTTIMECCSSGLLSEKQVVDAITQVIYHQPRMAVITGASIDTLDIIKVMDTKFANVIIIGAMYQAVAKRCGVRCELIAFPNHLFLEWIDNGDRAGPGVYPIDLATGELRPKRRCPFSLAQTNNYKYCPDSLLQFIHGSFDMTMGEFKNWNTINSAYLLDFLRPSLDDHNPYRNFLTYIIQRARSQSMIPPLELTNLNDAQIQLIRELSNLNTPEPFIAKECVPRNHPSQVRFAVGMIVYHKKFEYTGIIRAWELSCDEKWAEHVEAEDNREVDLDQPFYFLVAADQSERYVAQENLAEVTNPTRLYHLEDAIEREFTHFDGFSYVPNDEKTAEYPDDGPIVALYRTRSYYRK